MDLWVLSWKTNLGLGQQRKNLLDNSQTVRMPQKSGKEVDWSVEGTGVIQKKKHLW